MWLLQGTFSFCSQEKTENKVSFSTIQGIDEEKVVGAESFPGSLFKLYFKKSFGFQTNSSSGGNLFAGARCCLIFPPLSLFVNGALFSLCVGKRCLKSLVVLNTGEKKKRRKKAPQWGEEQSEYLSELCHQKKLKTLHNMWKSHCPSAEGMWHPRSQEVHYYIQTNFSLFMQ